MTLRPKSAKSFLYSVSKCGYAMMTLAQKAVALTAVLVVDVSMLAFGGVLFAAAALMASLPLTVSIAAK